MTEPTPLQYASRNSQSSVDSGHLRTLAICHYIWGALTMAFSSIFLIHVGLGIAMVSGAIPMTGTRGQPPPPAGFGYIFIFVGGCLVMLGWVVGGLTIASGRCMATRKRRVFSLVIAGISCASFPIGTVLGVFTFLVLLRPSVIAQYEMPAGVG